jgi:hypothetical protein
LRSASAGSQFNALAVAVALAFPDPAAEIFGLRAHRDHWTRIRRRGGHFAEQRP